MLCTNLFPVRTQVIVNSRKYFIRLIVHFYETFKDNRPFDKIHIYYFSCDF